MGVINIWTLDPESQRAWPVEFARHDKKYRCQQKTHRVGPGLFSKRPTTGNCQVSKLFHETSRLSLFPLAAVPKCSGARSVLSYQHHGQGF
jgi:hypothetical protein